VWQLSHDLTKREVGNAYVIPGAPDWVLGKGPGLDRLRPAFLSLFLAFTLFLLEHVLDVMLEY
jgi:hypothetical protein